MNTEMERKEGSEDSAQHNQDLAARKVFHQLLHLIMKKYCQDHKKSVSASSNELLNWTANFLDVDVNIEAPLNCYHRKYKLEENNDASEETVKEDSAAADETAREVETETEEDDESDFLDDEAEERMSDENAGSAEENEDEE